MNRDIHPRGTCPSDPMCPTPHAERQANPGVYETIAPSGYEGHIGHVPQGPALLFGLFLDHFDAPISDRSDEALPHLTDDNNATSLRCHICGSMNLVDDPAGLRCSDCGHLVWIDTGDGLLSVIWHDHDQGGLAPDDLPQCGSCERFCDTKTIGTNYSARMQYTPRTDRYAVINAYQRVKTRVVTDSDIVTDYTVSADNNPFAQLYACTENGACCDLASL